MHPLFASLLATVLVLPSQQPPASSSDELFSQAARLADKSKNVQAVALLDKIVSADPDYANAYYLRGREQFRLGKFKRSVKDFDRYVKLRPDRASRQWERGISLYYAGEFQKGAEQFKLYQTFHNNDVENSVWRYLCMARTEGVGKARETMLPIKNDRRVPMMQVFELYRGKLKPEDVLTAARQDSPSPSRLKSRLFYAHLYLGLYYEAAGNRELVCKYIFLAAAPSLKDLPGLNSYMWDVARVHAAKLRQKDKPSKEPRTTQSNSPLTNHE